MVEQYPVPQFIEREAKIAFFISFNQFIYLLLSGVVCFILYFILPLFLFLPLALVIVGGTLILTFLKVDGIPIAKILWNSLGFFAGTKHYTWKKKEVLYPFKMVKRVELKKITEQEGSKLKFSKKPGRLKKLSSKIELKTR